jgi:hypothetical protein
MVGARHAVRLLGALALVAIVAGCFSSKYSYVNNSAEGTFFKVPSGWKVYRLTEAEKEGRPPSLPSSVETVWHVAFDASTHPDQAHLQELPPADLVGEVQILALSPSANDSVSATVLRQNLFGVDPVLQDPGLPAKWELVSYAPIQSASGVVGSRAVINVPIEGEPGKFVTLDGSELLDQSTGRAYLLLMRCESQCYLNQQKSVDEIATSWKVTK